MLTSTPSVAGAAETHLLDVRNLSVSYSGRDGAVPIVRDVTLTVGPGKSLGIVGESGSGKSVLSRSIMGLDRARTASITGDVSLNGTSLTGLSARELRKFWGPEIAIVLQDPLSALNPVRRIGVQLEESLRVRLGLSRAAAHARAAELLQAVSIAEPHRRLRQFPHELSGGMRQRIVIAIAIACRPRFLIADEPTTALDVTVQDQILDLLQRLQVEQEMGLILISHDLGVVASRTDDVAVMYAGEIVENAPTERLFARPAMPYTSALLESIPRVEHSGPLKVIPGTPPSPASAITGCRFAARCDLAQNRCLVDAPRLEALEGDAGHLVRCWFPVGTSRGDDARQVNVARQATATGRSLLGTSAQGGR